MSEHESHEQRNLLKALTDLAREATRFLKNFGQKPVGRLIISASKPVSKSPGVSARGAD